MDKEIGHFCVGLEAIGTFEVSCGVHQRRHQPADRLPIRVACAFVGCRNGCVHAALDLGEAVDLAWLHRFALHIEAKRPVRDNGRRMNTAEGSLPESASQPAVA
jgi:hypothetical protein